MEKIIEIVTVKEFAAIIGISLTNVYRMVHAPGFPVIKPTKNTIRIFKYEAIEWIKNNPAI